VSSSVKQIHSHNADTIIVLRRGGSNTPVGIVTDSDIIDKVVMKGEDSDEVFLKLINILLFSAGTLDYADIN
jgi:trk system potassium uptake protein TrkH